MKLTLSIALAVMLGSSAAYATNQTSCQHSQQQNQYHCNVDGTDYLVSNVSNEAAAIAAANSFANSSSVSVANGGDADANSVAVNGGNSVELNEAEIPTFTGSVDLGIGINATILNGVEHANAKLIADALTARGLDCVALKVLFNTTQAKRAGLAVKCDITQ